MSPEVTVKMDADCTNDDPTARLPLAMVTSPLKVQDVPLSMVPAALSVLPDATAMLPAVAVMSPPHSTVDDVGEPNKEMSLAATMSLVLVRRDASTEMSPPVAVSTVP